LLENLPERRFKIAIPGQEVFEKFDAEKFDCLLEQRAMMPGELEPPVPLPGKHARNLQDQSRVFRHRSVLMADERREASNILVRNNRLVKESVQFIEPFDAIPLFARQSLALLTDVNAMATPAELLVRT